MNEPDLFEAERRNETERAATLCALREGLDDVDAGRTYPALAALKELARKHGLPAPRQER